MKESIDNLWYSDIHPYACFTKQTYSSMKLLSFSSSTYFNGQFMVYCSES